MARRNERHYEEAIRRLKPAAGRTQAIVAPLMNAVERFGGSVIGREIAPLSVLARIGRARTGRIASRPDVQAVLPAPRERSLLDTATPSTGATSWFLAGFNGGEGASDDPSLSTDVGTAGEAANPNHPAFDGVDVDDVGGGVSHHGTHVGGVIASQDTTFGGAAPGIDTLLGGTEARLLGFDDPYSGAGAGDPVEVMNLSFGSFEPDDNGDSPRDVLINVLDFGYAAGAGNRNGEIGSPGDPTVNNIGRNQMVIAHYNDNADTATSNDVIADASSNGPTPAGRKKPDLIAPGLQIMSPHVDSSGPAGFDAVGGSSFSAPFGAAALALLEGAGIGDPAAQRSILINAARDWDGQDNNIYHGWTPGNQGSWQPEVGWGALDLTQALADRANYDLASVEEGSARFFRALSTSGSKTTLAWELRGTWEGYPAPGTSPLIYTVSDLDLYQYRANTLDPIAPPADPGHGGGPDAGDNNDNVEQVRAPSGGGQMIYKVSSESTIEGLSSEPFSIASTEALTPLVNPEVEPFNSAKSISGAVNCSTNVTLTTSLRNQSDDLDAEDSEVSLGLPSGTTLVSGPATQEVSGGTLSTNETSQRISWTARATSTGTKKFTIEGSGGTMGETFRESQQITVVADCTPPSTSITAGPTSPFRDTTPTFSFGASEPDSTFECSIDGGAFASCSQRTEFGPFDQSTRTLSVRAVDAAGNRDPSPATRIFEVDREVTDADLTAKKKQRQKGKKIKVKLKASAQEAVSVAAKGKIKLPGRDAQLRRTSKDLDAGTAKVIRLVLAKKADRRRVLQALAARKKVRANPSARFTDEAGNRVSERRVVRLR